MTDSDLPQRSGSFRAVVQSGATVTAYLRIGRGRPVLMLRHGDLPLPAWDGLLATLSGSWRVLAPDLPVPPDDLAAWLPGFLDGLGLAETAAVADPSLAAATMAFVAADPNRISRLVILTVDGIAPAGVDRVPVPCHLLDTSMPGDRLVSEATWFLSGAPLRLGDPAE